MNEEIQNFKKWKPLSDLNTDIKTDLLKKIRPISFKMGTLIWDFNSLPNGIILISDGKIREVYRNENKEIYTIKNYQNNEIVGITELLRGVNDCAFIASENTKGYLIPSFDFLRNFLTNYELISKFKEISFQEIISLFISNPNSFNLEFLELINLIKKSEFTKKDITLLNPGNQKIKINKNQNFLVSTNNIENYPLGSIIKDSQNVTVKGKLPARLVSFRGQELNNFLLNKSQITNSFSENLDTNNKINITEQSIEAFQDLYGNLKENIQFPHQEGKGTINETTACLRMLCRYYDLPFRREVIRNILNSYLNKSPQKFLNIEFICSLIELTGISSNPINPKDINYLKRASFPILSYYKNNLSIIWGYKNKRFIISNPSQGQKLVSTEELLKDKEFFNTPKLSFEILNRERTKSFDFKWFIPYVKNYKYTFIQVIIASFFFQLLGLFNPLLIQQIIDAVINQGNISSLNILGILLVTMSLAQALIGSLRTYIFSDVTNRIDISLGSKVINHLLRLPIKYFIKRQVGEVSSRLNELENIRHFLTSTALTAILDGFFSFIYIAVMVLYSLKLTIVSLVSVPLLALIAITLTPIIKNQLKNKAEARAKVQSQIVELLSGIETVKNQNIELISEWRWKKLYGKEVNSSFKNIITSSSISYFSQFLSQVSGLLVIWVGATLVLKGELTLGQLIAFRILSGYVTTPLLRLSSIWQNFQETCLSIERLSDVIDYKKEDDEIEDFDKPPLPSLSGKIEYKSVFYKFQKNQPAIISNISLNIKEKSFVGIVGESGSGKSTLLKLLPRLINPDSGKILIDNFDISKVNLKSLRSQIGIVSQESILFNQSVQSNISLVKPEATFEEILFAAKLAEADKFINQLPNGYGTIIGEKGSILSGGQKQRISIARTILKNPKLLILDESTSSLDLKTESKILNNIFTNYKESTIIFITHRIMNLIKADNIFVLDNGILKQAGKHKDLINEDGIYKNLYNQQFKN